METIVDGWHVGVNFLSNADKARAEWTGYAQDQDHWDVADITAIRDSEYARSMLDMLSRHVGNPVVYFYQHPRVNYDPIIGKGNVCISDIEDFDPEAAEEISSLRDETRTLFVLTNNISDWKKIHLNSRWIFAHRISHILLGQSRNQEAHLIQDLGEDFIKRVAKIYGVHWPDDDGDYLDHLIGLENYETYGKVIAHDVGTMRSARTELLRDHFEWFHEMVAQYLVCGKIPMRSDMQGMREYMSVGARGRGRIEKMVGRFQHRMEEAIKAALRTCAGTTMIG